MVHTFLVIVLFFVMFVSPCAVASSIDLDAEEANSAEVVSETVWHRHQIGDEF
jgi:hypothetical protein